MLSKEAILAFSLAYLLLLFAIAYYGDKRASSGQSIISNSFIYALSLGVYCTAWTFYGSVGRATETGVGFLAVYIGPTLSVVLGWVVLRKIIRICRLNRIISIADFVAARYGKSATLGGVVTVIAVLGIIPYISVQIKAISTTYFLVSQYPLVTSVQDSLGLPIFQDTAFYVTCVLALFALLFGARQLDATKRHEGLVAAIAFESLVKLIAFISVGIFVTYVLYDGFGDLFTRAQAVPEIRRLFIIDFGTSSSASWYTTLVLSMLAFLFLPRQFQVSVIENVDERHLHKAMWLFPLYLLLINLFVLPVAIGGMLHFSSGTVDADTFVLTLPMGQQQKWLTLLVFIGGISAATGMVIVETVALSTMICNDLVMVVLLRLNLFQLDRRDDLSRLLLTIRQGSILLVMFMGYTYFHLVVKHYTLVSIGLISFTAVAQFAPAILGGIFWKRGTKAGALCGLVAGFLLWAYTLVLPSLAQAGFLSESFLGHGPFGISLLRPYQLFNLDVVALGFDPYVHALFWSMLVNIGLYVGVSFICRQSAREHTQATLFVDVFKYSEELGASFWRGTASLPDLESLLARFLGSRRAKEALERYEHDLQPEDEQRIISDSGFVNHVEKLLAGAIGSASARVMVASVVKEELLTTKDVMDILNETRKAISHSLELEKVAQELKNANERLQELDKLKDEFISTVTHELRTPLTSVRAVAEVLHYNPDISKDDKLKFTKIIIEESERLTRLIADILDFQKIESGKIGWEFLPLDAKELVLESIAGINQLLEEKGIELQQNLSPKPMQVTGDSDRLKQVILNLLSNAVKFCDAEKGVISISLYPVAHTLQLTVTDNGIGIHPKDQDVIFEEFRQVKDASRGRPQGTGLGLSITRRILEEHGGRIFVSSELGKGATFTISLPLFGSQKMADRGNSR
jgi:signal transduction histidine kinase/Na+/proline symporter